MYTEIFLYNLTKRKLVMKTIATLIAGLVAVTAFAAEPAKAPAAPAPVVAAPAVASPTASKPAHSEKKAKKEAAKVDATKSVPAAPAVDKKAEVIKK
jgi:hypothetical protein